MRISQLTAYFRNLYDKERTVLRNKTYRLRCNKQMKQHVRKLQSMGLVSDVSFCGNDVIVKLNGLLHYKVMSYHVVLNKLNQSIIYKTYLQGNPYCDLIVTTSRGLMTYDQCVRSNIGGVIKALVSAKVVLR